MRRYHLALGNDAHYFQMHLRELASHRMDKREKSRPSIRDLRVMLDELVADVLGDGRLRFIEVERRVQEPAGGCLKFFLSHESFSFSFRHRWIITPSSRDIGTPSGPASWAKRRIVDTTGWL